MAALTVVDTTPATYEEARKHTDKTKRHLSLSYAGVQEAHDRAMHTALGYSSWGEYLRTEFDGLYVIKATEEQAARFITVCRDEGMSYSQIARMLGMSVGYVHKRAPKDQQGYTVGDDGKKRAKTSKRPVVVPEVSTDDATSERRYFISIVIATVKGTGAAGCTSRAVEDALKEGHQRVSAALSRASKGAGARLAYIAPEKRGMFGRYIDPAHTPKEM